MRIAGALFLFAFFCLLGIYAGEREKQRLAECEAFSELFGYIKNQINYFLTPTKVMYRNFSNKVLEECGFLPALRSHENDEVYHGIWRASLESCKKDLLVRGRCMELILDFGECIGKSHGQIQTNSFDYYIAEMKNIIEKEKTESEKNIRLYRTLGITAGACAAILAI